jgi:hypothetical protein
MNNTLTAPFDKVPAFFRPVITGRGLDALKLFALGLMVVDHVNYIVLDSSYYWAYLLGRGAWPLFAFAAAVAFLRANDAGLIKQAKLLFICALISEPISQIARDVPPNILFTLALSCVLALMMRRLPEKAQLAICLLAPALMAWPSMWEFGVCGALLPVAIAQALGGRGRYWWAIAVWLSLFMSFGGWLVRDFPPMLVAQTSLACLLLPLGAIWLLREILAERIDGERFLPRYALHAFYPLHLLALLLLSFLL